MNTDCRRAYRLIHEALIALDVAQMRLSQLRADADGHDLIARGTDCRCYHRGETSYRDLNPGPPRAA